MQIGIKLRIYPKPEQKEILSQWMGCHRVIWNAKCDQWRYESTYARKYLPVKTYAPIDAAYAHFRDPELTPYLQSVPAEILKAAANNWRNTMRQWLDRDHPQKGPARRKQKSDAGSIFLEKRLFSWEQRGSSIEVFIGSQSKNIGSLRIRSDRTLKVPSSLRIRKKAGFWWVSFSYEDGVIESNDQETLASLQKESAETLQAKVIGIDRGVAIPAVTNEASFGYTSLEKARLTKRLKNLKRYQKRMARQIKGSQRRQKTKLKISQLHQRIANVRDNSCHKVSHQLTKEPGKVLVLEDLKTRPMTKRPKAKKNPKTGKWEKNGARRKAGLNRKILEVGWHKLESQFLYKSRRRKCLVAKINPHFSSQECAACQHIDSANRVTQALFACTRCGHRDNADRNAACVLKKRAIKLLLNFGTKLSERNVLSLPDIGRGDQSKTSKLRRRSRVSEASKKKVGCRSSPEALPL